jgi:hypothetical protein
MCEPSDESELVEELTDNVVDECDIADVAELGDEGARSALFR